MKYLLIVVVLAYVDANCTIRQLYTDIDVRISVFEALSPIFAQRFEKLMTGVTKNLTFLEAPARYFEKTIKDKFIEEGLVLKTAEDLIEVLDKLHYLEIEKFRAEKHKSENE